MLSRSHLFAGTALATMFAASQSAHADLISWTVSGDFDDGGTFSGTFTYDNVANTATAWNLSTSSGTAGVGPNTYSSSATADTYYTSGSSEIGFNDLLSVLGPYGTYVNLEFDDLPFATAGTVAALTGEEFDQSCFLTFECETLATRAITSGTAVGTDTSVPEPASGAIMLAGIGLLGVYRRRHCRGV